MSCRPSFSLCVLLAAAGCGPAGDLHGQLADEPSPSAGVTPSGNRVPEPPPLAGCPTGTLAEIETKVFANRCNDAGCHAAANPAEGLDLTAPIETLRGRLLEPSHESPSGVPLVTPHQYGASFLYLKVFFRTPVTGDAMPPAAALPACELEAIKRWIQNGATD